MLLPKSTTICGISLLGFFIMCCLPSPHGGSSIENAIDGDEFDESLKNNEKVTKFQSPLNTNSTSLFLWVSGLFDEARQHFNEIDTTMGITIAILSFLLIFIIVFISTVIWFCKKVNDTYP
nr:MAG: hypothetical protein [Porcellio scaber clopovirus]